MYTTGIHPLQQKTLNFFCQWYTLMEMANSPCIPLRLTPTQIARLDAVAERLLTTRAAILRMCAESFCEQFERKGVAILPPNWEQLLLDADHRTHSKTHSADPLPPVASRPVIGRAPYDRNPDRAMVLNEVVAPMDASVDPAVAAAFQEITGMTVGELDAREATAKRAAEAGPASDAAKRPRGRPRKPKSGTKH